MKNLLILLAFVPIICTGQVSSFPDYFVDIFGDTAKCQILYVNEGTITISTNGLSYFYLQADGRTRYFECPFIKNKPSSDGKISTEQKTTETTVSNQKQTKKEIERQDIPERDSTAKGQPIFTGPRGGRYHYSPSGNKVYEKRKR